MTDWVKGLVSVIVPVYNSRETIVRTLLSIDSQDYRPLEIMVVDDGSSDGTIEVVQGLGLETVIMLSLPSNQGASAARNEGIRQSRGEYIAFLDSDDIWLPEKLSRQVSILKADKNVSLVCCDFENYLNGQLTYRFFDKVVPAEGYEAWKTILKNTFVSTPCVMTRRSTLEKVGYFNEKLFIGEDQDMWIRLATNGKVAIINKPLVKVFSVPGSLAKKMKSLEPTQLLPMIKSHLIAQRSRLTAAEVRDILGLRCFRTARNQYWNGQYLTSIRIFITALRYRCRPLTSLRYIVLALIRGMGLQLNFSKLKGKRL